MAMEEQAKRWMELVLVVPETLLLVGTSEGVFTSINDACDLLGEYIWAVEDTYDVDSASNTSGGGEHSFGLEVPLDTTCGVEHSFGVRLDTIGGDKDSYAFGVPFNPTCGGKHTFGVPLDTTGGGEHSYGFGVHLDNSGGGKRTLGFGLHLETTGGGECIDDDDDTEITLDDTIGCGERTDDLELHPGIDYWGNLLASAFAPNGPLTAAHREITRLLSLHGEAGHVFALCAGRLGLQHDDAPWQRWREHRAAAVARAHDALLRLSSAASATAAAEDFVRWWSAESPLRKDWWWVARQLVHGARRDVDGARDTVKLMRDAVAREFFETWMILKRA